jgi:hypothetical protein
MPRHVNGLDHDELASADRLGDLLERRELKDAPNRGDLVGNRARPLEPGVQHLGRALPREEEDAGVDVRDRVQLDLERGDDAEAAAAPRSAQNRSASWSASTRRSCPSAVTSSMAAMLLADRPSFRAYQPTPPPSE